MIDYLLQENQESKFVILIKKPKLMSSCKDLILIKVRNYYIVRSLQDDIN